MSYTLTDGHSPGAPVHTVSSARAVVGVMQPIRRRESQSFSWCKAAKIGHGFRSSAFAELRYNAGRGFNDGIGLDIANGRLSVPNLSKAGRPHVS